MRRSMIAGHDSGEGRAESARPAYFWWFLANMLALSFAVGSWLFCLHVFGNPEIPRNYQILRKLGRLPEIKRHTVLDVPNGGLMDPKALYSRYINMERNRMEILNRRMMRNYLTNFDHALGLAYIEGDYRVEEVRPLGAEDWIRDGLVVRARGMVLPDQHLKPVSYPVVIDYLFPTGDPVSAGAFRAGDWLEVRKSPNCAAILHVDHIERNGEKMVCVTVVPIAYGAYRIGGGESLAIEPPAEVNLEAEFPLFR